VLATRPAFSRRDFALASWFTAFYEARLKPAEDISVLLHDDARNLRWIQGQSNCELSHIQIGQLV
jgi:hypothetical protein